MRKGILILALLTLSLAGYGQESTATYKRAVDVVINSSEFKRLNVDKHTFSKQSISFLNSAYAFYLEDPNLQFIEYNFDNYFGTLYQPIEINEFKALGKRKKAQHILYVSETEQDHFIIELLHFKRKKRSKYPKFYKGVSYSFLFKKEVNGDVTYIRTIRIVNQ